MLCLTFARAKLYLYRPLLYLTADTSDAPECSDHFSSTCSPFYLTAYTRTSQQIIALCEDMCRRGLLTGPNWMCVHILLSAALTLFHVIVTTRRPDVEESLLKSFATGRKLLGFLAKRSFQARRCKITLMVRLYFTKGPPGISSSGVANNLGRL